MRTIPSAIGSVLLVGLLNGSVVAQDLEDLTDPVPPDTPAEDVSEEHEALRIGIQGRVSALNVVLAGDADAGDQVPFATLGLRFFDQRLFAGLGFGFFGVEGSNTGFSFSPLATLDFYQDDDLGALYGALWLTLANFDDDRAMMAGDVFVWGLSAAVGVRAKVATALGIGAEWGWGFLSLNRDGSAFVHGFTGNLLVEVTLGI